MVLSCSCCTGGGTGGGALAPPPSPPQAASSEHKKTAAAILASRRTDTIATLFFLGSLACYSALRGLLRFESGERSAPLFIEFANHAACQDLIEPPFPVWQCMNTALQFVLNERDYGESVLPARFTEQFRVRCERRSAPCRDSDISISAAGNDDGFAQCSPIFLLPDRIHRPQLRQQLVDERTQSRPRRAVRE